MVPSYSGHGSNTMTPPATPPTGPRPNQSHDAPRTSLHGPSTSPLQPATSSQSLLPRLSNTNCVAAASQDTKNTSTMAIRVSADGVWENSTSYTLTNDAPLGVGAWSSVHLAIPSEDCRSIPTTAAADTPPATPVGRSTQGFSKLTVPPPSRRSSATPATTTTETQQPGFASLNSIKASAVWAIKAPINKTAQTVIRSEARILSRVFSHQPQAPAQYIVPFHGLDPQMGNLVMDALPLTLDDFIKEDLSTLPEPRRVALLARLFPPLAQHLLGGLDWLHNAAGVVHADIKPSNVLLRPTRAGVAAAMLHQRLQSATSLAVGATLMRPSLLAALSDEDAEEKSTPASRDASTHANLQHHLAFIPLYTDFSAAFSLRPDAPVTAPSGSSDTTMTTPPTSPTHAVRPAAGVHYEQITPKNTSTITTPTPPPFAAGTWDFLAPELCRATAPPPIPTPSSDVYALGITFLFLLTGSSPFDAVAQGNAIRRREMIRVGDAVGFAGMDAKGGARLRGLGRALGTDRENEKEREKRWMAWLRAGLEKRVEQRMAAREWGAWLGGEFGCGGGGVGRSG